MKHYKVVHVQRQNYPVAYLSYDTKTQQFSLRIRKDVKLSSLPGMMRLFAQKGLGTGKNRSNGSPRNRYRTTREWYDTL